MHHSFQYRCWASIGTPMVLERIRKHLWASYGHTVQISSHFGLARSIPKIGVRRVYLHWGHEVLLEIHIFPVRRHKTMMGSQERRQEGKAAFMMTGYVRMQE